MENELLRKERDWKQEISEFASMVQATDNAVLNGATAKGMKKEVATLTLETLMESHPTFRHYILLSCCK